MSTYVNLLPFVHHIKGIKLISGNTDFAFYSNYQEQLLILKLKQHRFASLILKIFLKHSITWSLSNLINKNYFSLISVKAGKNLQGLEIF